MQDWLIDILRNSRNGERLTVAPDGLSLVCDGGSFDVCDGVPLLLDTSTPPHTASAAGNAFDYTSHYAEDAKQFDYFSEKRDRLTTVHLRELRRSVLRMVPRSTGLPLDVGCGCAFVAEHLCRRGTRVVSMDIAPANARKALAQHPSDNHAAVAADAYHLPFADNTFDCIIASEIIEHTVDPQGFVASLLSKLKPGGTLIVSTPYKERIAYSLCIHCNCKTPHNAHLHSFDKDKLRHIVEPLPANITRMRLVGNKLLLRTHLLVPLALLGHHVWRLADNTLNTLIPKAEHLIIVIQKQKK